MSEKPVIFSDEDLKKLDQFMQKEMESGRIDMNHLEMRKRIEAKRRKVNTDNDSAG